MPGTPAPAAPMPASEPPISSGGGFADPRDGSAATGWSPPAAPAWASSAPPGPASRTTVIIAAGAVIVLLLAGVGFVALRQSIGQNDAGSTAGVTSPATVSPSTSTAASAPSTLPLTAQLSGDYCPVAHPGDAACWKGSLVNTGPPIGKLAFIFIVGSPYSNWFANHANGTLSGFYTSPGCEVDAAHVQIVCGSVGANQQVDVYLGGDVTTRGAFTYAVKFADISGPTPVYVNQRSDGTHDVVEWREVIG